MDVVKDNDPLASARKAYRRRDWITARDQYTAALEGGELDSGDLYALGNSHWWLGMLDQALPFFQEAHRRYLVQGQGNTAALVALTTGYSFALKGDEAQASGWMSRAVRLLDEAPECPERGYLAHIGFEDAFRANDLPAAIEHAHEVRIIGQRFADPTLLALGVLGEGRVLVKRGRIADGLRLLDEAMVAAVSDDLDPSWAGNIYCHLMLACYELMDWRRATEWTEATARWCEEMPGAGPFMGICRVHRAQVLQARGAWEDAEREIRRVCEELSTFHVGLIGTAQYHLGDLRRQRGDWTGAAAAFAEARRRGCSPEPGHALLCLARHRTNAAVSSIERALAAEKDPLARAGLLSAAAEIAIAADDPERARSAASELADIADRYATTGLAARAATAEGITLLATGQTADALEPLLAAREAWHHLGSPYEAAVVRLRLAQAYEVLGDVDARTVETEAADGELARLGAVRPPNPRLGVRPDGLTARELTVLDLLAAGRSNQEIADKLVLSVRTVERHLATVYRKLGLSGRSARAAAVRYTLHGEIAAGDQQS